MITIKFYELEHMLPSLIKLLDKELPINISYQLYKLTKKVNEEYKFYNKKRSELIEKYAERDENNKIKIKDGGIPIKKDLLNECNKQLKELDNLSFDIEFTPISLKSLGEKFTISAKDLLSLDKILTE